MKAEFKKKLKEIKALVDEANDMASSLCADMQDWYDDHSDRWFESDAACDAEDLISSVEEISSDIESVIDSINDLI